MEDLSIVLHAHCRNCAARKPRHQSMSEWNKTETGLTKSGLLVRCRRCDMVVAHFTPERLQEMLERFPTADGCECCAGGRHVQS